MNSIHAADNVFDSSKIAELQDYLNNISNAGGTVYLKGDFINSLFNLNITNSITIMAEGIVNIVGNGTTNLFNVNASNVNIIGFNIKNYDIAINSTEANLTVNKNNISNSTKGILINTTKNNSNNNISENNINVKDEGVHLRVESGPHNPADGNINNNIISNNNISTSNDWGDGVYLFTDEGNEISNNTVNGNNIRTKGEEAKGVHFYAHSGSISNNRISSNNINTSGPFYSEGIYLAGFYNINNTNIENNKINTINNQSSGIYLTTYWNDIENTMIINNNIKTTGTESHSIILEGGGNLNNNIISQNFLNTTGINSNALNLFTYDGDIKNTFITNNNISSTNKNTTAIQMESGLNILSTIIKGNNILSNGTGINITALDEVNNNNVSYNRILTNDSGLFLSSNDNNNSGDFNWWGDNDPISKNKSNIYLNNYFTMFLETNENNYTKSVGDILNFYYYFVLNGTHDNADAEKNMPYFLANLYLNGNDKPFKVISGSKSTELSTKIISKNMNISANLDYQWSNISLVFKKGITYIPIEKHYPSLGKQIYLITKLLDKNGDPIANKLIDFFYKW